MIKIIANNYVKPDKVEEFITMAKEMVIETRKEKGCHSYMLCKEVNHPTHLTFIEEWEDMESISQHKQSKHYTKIIPQLHELWEKEGKVSLYEDAFALENCI